MLHWIAAGLLLVFCPSSFGDEQLPKRIRVGTNFAVPWAYLSPDGAPAGFFVEVMREAARREGVEVEMVLRRDSVDNALPTNEIDLWAGAVSTEERRRRFYFTKPWWSLDHYVAVMESSSIRSLKDLAGHTVLFTPRPPFSVDLKQFLPGSKPEPMPGLRERFVALCSGRADAVLFYQETELFSITGANDLLDCRQRGMRIIPILQPIMDLSIVSLPARRQLADRLHSRVAQMMRDQSISRLPSFRMTGDNSMMLILQAEQSQYRQQILQVSLTFTLGVVLLCAVAYARLRLANKRAVLALDAAKRAAQSKGEFLALMSHEIRTPMTAVLGYMEMLLSTPLRHDQRQFAIEVSQATSSLLTMLTTVLDYSRSLGGTLPSHRTEFDLAAVIDDSVAGVLLQAESKGLEVTVQLDTRVPEKLTGDAVRIRHMVTNLATNAVKFTERGWIHVEANYTHDVSAGATLEVSISDSGVGISKEKQRDIFLPFTQVDSSDSRSAAGIGLGLAIVSDLCKQVGGTVSLDSEPGKGSRFTLNIPVAAAGEASWLEFLRQPGVSLAIILSPPTRQVTILQQYLLHAGYQVELVSSVKQAESTLNRLETAPVHRIFCLADGNVFGRAVSVNVDSCRERAGATPFTLVLLGSMRYLSGPGQQVKSVFDRVLPLPSGRRALREAFLPQSIPHLPDPLEISNPVLVVDDNPVNRRVLSALLEKLGCSVETAVDGKEAVTKALENDYELILMDCQMPQMSGYEAASAIRRGGGRGERVPICGLSAAVDPDVRERCLAAGMNDYTPKPVTLEGLKELVVRFQRSA